MGGYGSGRGWSFSAKRRVESCSTLDVNWMTREGMFDGGRRWGSIRWSNSLTEGETSSIGYEVNAQELWIRLHYGWVRDDKCFDYKVPLTTTELPWGGIRRWFQCPLIRNENPCGRRVGKLYRPPGGHYYGCRHCYDLTYESCQESHRYDNIFTMSDQEIRIVGINPHEELACWRRDEHMMRQVQRNKQRRRRRKALNWS